VGALRFGPDYHERIRLADGTPAVLRLLRPDDRALFVTAFDRLSPATRYRRFAGVKTQLNPTELDFLLSPDGDRHFALAAGRPRNDRDDGDGDGPNADRVSEGLGVARFVRLADDPSVAEPAVVVVDHVQGLGLGAQLLRRLLAAAAERGIRALRFVVLASNEPMRSLLRDHVAGVREVPEGDEVVVEVPLEPPVSSDDVSKPPPNLFQRFLSLAARSGLVLVGRRPPPMI
jgi:GNAT superfamily N-acetyltransferase